MRKTLMNRCMEFVKKCIMNEEENEGMEKVK